jgi:hypothetical protein
MTVSKKIIIDKKADATLKMYFQFYLLLPTLAQLVLVRIYKTPFSKF